MATIIIKHLKQDKKGSLWQYNVCRVSTSRVGLGNSVHFDERERTSSFIKMNWKWIGIHLFISVEENMLNYFILQEHN